MTTKDKFREILDNIFRESKSQRINLTKEQLDRVTLITKNAQSQKSVLAVLITSLLKKVENPKQDVRLHREEFKNGYSGRSLDFNVVTPWLKEQFHRFAPKESGWLTRSLEQPHPFNLKFPGKIQKTDVKEAFLEILDDIERRGASAQNYLIAILTELNEKTFEDKKAGEELSKISTKGIISINLILKMLEEHFETKKSSRLPVIAIYSIYQILAKQVEIYKNKKLEPLKTHTASDRYMGFGDIEIYNNDGTPFEIVEIKHNIPIDLVMVKDALKKVQDAAIKRYFVLTTAYPNFKMNESEIHELIQKIKAKHGIDFVANGIIPSIKYYLRFLPDLKEFVNTYTKNLSEDYKKSVSIQDYHLKKWKQVLEENNLVK